MAIAWEKPVFLFRDDFRRCTDSEVYPLNLMLFTGLPADGWEAAWYGSLEQPERFQAELVGRVMAGGVGK